MSQNIEFCNVQKVTTFATDRQVQLVFHSVFQSNNLLASASEQLVDTISFEVSGKPRVAH